MAFISATFNVRPCLPGDMSQGNPPSLAFGARDLLCGVCTGKTGVVTSPILLLQPERINPELNQKGYNVKSDVWSLGITMVMPGAGICIGSPGVRMGFGLVGLYPCCEQWQLGGCPSSWTQFEHDSSGQQVNYPGIQAPSEQYQDDNEYPS